MENQDASWRSCCVGEVSITLCATTFTARSIYPLRLMEDKTPYLRSLILVLSATYSSISHNLSRHTFPNYLNLEADSFRVSFRRSTSPFNSLRSVSSLRPPNLTLQHHVFTLPLCNSPKSHIFSAQLFHVSHLYIATLLSIRRSRNISLLGKGEPLLVKGACQNQSHAQQCCAWAIYQIIWRI